MGKQNFNIIVGSDKKKVKISNDGYGLHLLTMLNGFQWSGSPVDDELLDMIGEAIFKYKVACREKHLVEALEDLEAVASAYKEYIDALPADVVFNMKPLPMEYNGWLSSEVFSRVAAFINKRKE